MPSTTAVDVELAARLRVGVARLARLLRQQDGQGLTPTMTAVLATVGREGPLTLGELAAAERVAPPTITKLAAKLEGAGLLVRRADPSDGRVSRVELTEAGTEQLLAIRTRRAAWLTDRIEALDPADRDRLLDAVVLVERLVEAER